MTTNPLAARRAEPVYEVLDKQFLCDKLNGYELTHKMDRFYYVKETQSSATGEIIETVECMDLPTGTRGWIRENEARVKGLIRKMTGGTPHLVAAIYQRTLAAAPVPIPWDKMRVI
jgi:hypothetical protein